MQPIPADCLFVLLLLLLMIYMKISGENSLLYYKLTTDETMKYILIWYEGGIGGKGQDYFIQHNCPVKNCFITSNRKYLNYVKNYDAILFHGPQLVSENKTAQIGTRSPRQVYIFWSAESAHNYPVKNDAFNNYFNWTFTYRLDSDVAATYIIVKDKKGNVVGPNERMNWIEDDKMLPIDDRIKKRLKRKYKAAAWIASACHTKSKRERFVRNLQNKLNEYKLTVDTYGKCGMICDNCWNKVRSDYYFYLAFENSFTKDYVTEKVLKSLQFYAVPIVYGTANYSRFLPKGSYLNAMELGAKRLAKEMYDIINDKERYYSFFKWHNHYSFHSPEEDPATDNYCRLCAALNHIDTPRTQSNFTDWWNCKRITQLFSRNCGDISCLD